MKRNEENGKKQVVNWTTTYPPDIVADWVSGPGVNLTFTVTIFSVIKYQKVSDSVDLSIDSDRQYLILGNSCKM